MRCTWSRVAVGVLVPALAVLVTAVVSRGQERPSAVILAGVAPFDLAGTGTTGVVGAAVAFPLATSLTTEIGVRVLHYASGSGSTNTYVFPEASLRVRPPLQSRVRPYLYLGGGPVIFSTGIAGSALTLHAGLGARIGFGQGWFLRPDARLRSVDPWTGSDLELTVGIGRSF